MRPTAEEVSIGSNWPPEKGQAIRFKSAAGVDTGVVAGVKLGLVWRDYFLEDGRVIPEHKVLGCPEPPAWRDPNEVPREEREACEERLVSMAGGGLDPRDRDQPFWAELNQYLAYIYLRFKQPAMDAAAERPGDAG